MWRKKSFRFFLGAWLSITTLFGPSVLFAKELILPLSRNPLTKSTDHLPVTKSPNTLLGIPFLEDFSQNQNGLPVGSRWNKSQVFVNEGYGIASPSPFSATFDVLNVDGELYPHASYDNFGADTLSSNPIALSSYTATDSVTLYFQIQAAGNGSFPSDGDSICLEFYDPHARTWQLAWSARPYSLNQIPKSLLFKNWLLGRKKEQVGTDSIKVSELFYPILISLPTNFLVDSFAFRFRNVGSLSRLDAVPGIIGNTDHWNLSLIYLNKRDANDTTFFRDVLLMRPAKSVLRLYSAMPWKHFKGNSAAQLLLMDDDRVQTFKMTYRSAKYRPLQVSRQFFIDDLSTGHNEYQTEALWDRLDTDQSYEYVYRGYDYNFHSDAVDSVDFRIRSVLSYSGAQAPYTLNDTLSYIQHFKDYYSYDDNQAENGYGIFGRWAGGSMVAIKYTNQLTTGDTLKGVYLYFNRSYQDANKISFKLAVWNDFNGYPGTRIYDTISVTPTLAYGGSGWEYFQLAKPVIVRGDFYIGWEQVGESMLNIGFDKNCTVTGKHFINEGSGWILSAYNGKGLPMIRPAFGHFPGLITSATALQLQSDWRVYPNPSRGSLFVKHTSGGVGVFQVKLFSVQGRLLRTWYGSPYSLELGELAPGYYFIRIEVPGKLPYTQPIVIK